VPNPGVGPRAFVRITQVTVVLVVLNIVTGAAVRLSDSGLGCPDWPTCFKRQITPPLSLHPVIEFGNRMVVGVLCAWAALTLVAAARRRPWRRDLVWLAAGLLAGILGEAVLGAVVVYSKLNPYVVMTHFMVGIALLSDALVLALRAGRPEPGGDVRALSKVGRRERLLTRAMIGLLAVALVAGTATTGAGPHAGGADAKRIPVALADMARIHSGFVLVLGASLLALLYLLDRTRAPESVLRRGRVLLVVMAAQGVIGYTQYFSHLPPLLVGVHVFGATVVWSAMLWFHDGLTFHGAPSSLGVLGGSGARAAVAAGEVPAAVPR